MSLVWLDNELVSLENIYSMFNYFKIIELKKTQIWNIFIPQLIYTDMPICNSSGPFTFSL